MRKSKPEPKKHLKVILEEIKLLVELEQRVRQKSCSNSNSCNVCEQLKIIEKFRLENK